MKIKVGAEPDSDLQRVVHARSVIGPDTSLYVDANGAYTRKQALAFAELFSTEAGVTWFEEPVSSDDLEGLRLLRDRAPAGMDIAAGEYGYDLFYFRRMLDAGAVDVLQADVDTLRRNHPDAAGGGALRSSRDEALCTHKPRDSRARRSCDPAAGAC